MRPGIRNGSAVGVRPRVAALGEDNAEVLGPLLGYDAARIAAVRPTKLSVL